ncbi:hypothetical protein PMI15_00526 [Polaromonas sp. CF318]|uniref:hypothetical protein n=1 Tax=Polaromonas sp. CF318 TaxID=1144318 RepID=UPI0002714424|nr:hypothetical protein [Polaromonas sp. CF318]EJL89697.1 hypothetical protein PMI15_00526 [Polaromonas sp. CF318]
MSLDYLHFDCAEGSDGTGVLEAMASTWPEQVPAVHAEVVRVLAWAHAEFPGRRGPLEEGFDWDYNLHGMRELTAPEALLYDEAAGRLAVQPGLPGKARHTLTLTLSGNAGFCEAFRQQFGLD